MASQQFEWIESPFWRWWYRSLLQRSYVRISIQVAAATFLILAAFSTPAAWEALSLDPILANPSLILVLTVVQLLFSVGTGLSAPQIAVEGCVGALLGGGLELGVSYMVYGINGGSTDLTVTKAVLTIVFGCVLLFWMGASRFKYRKYNFLFFIMGMTFGVGLAGSYHMPNRIWRFSLYWWAFMGVGAVVTLLVSSFVLPFTAGYVVRKSLAKALRLEGVALSSIVDMMTSELDDRTGLLKKASGQASIVTGVDSGLEGDVVNVHASSMATNLNLQTAMNHMRAATLEWDIYRPTHIFPSSAFDALLMLARTMLSPAMMLFYPIQTGKMRLTLCRHHATELQALAAAFQECCNSLADVLRYNAPVQFACASLDAMETAYVSLMKAALHTQWESAGAGAPLPNDRLALNMALSLLFTCCTRLRRMHALLPEALGRDQPGGLAYVRQHFRASSDWDFASLAQSSLQQSRSTRRMVRQSLIGPQSSTKELVASLLQSKPLAVQVYMSMPSPTKKVGIVSRALRWIEQRLGYSKAHLSLGLQIAVAYAVVMVLLVVTASYEAVRRRSTWTVFIVVAIHEPLAGSAVWKCILRIGGTVVAGLLGLGALYFTVLCNGLSFANRPPKFIVMTLSLTLLSAPLAAGAVKFGVRNTYFWIISCIVMFTVALPDYSLETPLPKLALWRLICTIIGVGVEMVVSQTVFPVTARMTYRTLMAETLASLADVVDAGFHSVLPKTQNRRGTRGTRSAARKGALEGEGADRPKGQPARLEGEEEEEGDRSVHSRGVAALPSIAEHDSEAQQMQKDATDVASLGAGGVGPFPAGLGNGEADMARVSAYHHDSAALDEAAEIGGQHQHEEKMEEGKHGKEQPSAMQGSAAAAAVEPAEAQLSEEEMPLALLPPRRSTAASAGGSGKGGLESGTGSHRNEEEEDSSPMALPSLPTEEWDQRPTILELHDSSHSSMHPPLPGETATLAAPPGPLHADLAGAGTNLVRQLSTSSHSIEIHRRGSSNVEDPQAVAEYLERLSTMSNASGMSGISGVSEYAKLDEDLQPMIFGRVMVYLRPAAMKVALKIATQSQILGPVQYEFNPFADPPRFPVKSGRRATRLCRRALNIITAFAITMDSHRTTRIPLLTPHAPQLERLLQQLKEAFRAMARMVTGEGSIAWAVRCVANVEVHLEELMLRVAVQGESGTGVSDGEAMQGLAFLSMLFNTSYVARLLCIALTHAFFPTSPEAQEDIADLVRDPARWALDEKLILLAGEILGAAVAAPQEREAHTAEVV